MKKKNIWKTVIEWQNWKNKTKVYKRNKDEIRNSKNKE